MDLAPQQPSSHPSEAFVPSCLRGTLDFNAKLATFARDIKISHTVFAMPWALLSTFLAAKGWPRPGQLILILVCMITARTLAMATNRVLDAHLDALNPRTRGRAIPAGRLSQAFFFITITLCAAGFVAACAGFAIWYSNPWPVRLGGPVLMFLAAYPLLKRFTRFCHYYLGMALALAPVCAYVAIAGTIAMPPIWMALAVTLWTAGFDIIYACQDYDADVAQGVFSVPSKLGIAGALWVSRLTHVGCVAMLIMVGLSARPVLGPIYFSGVGLAAALLVVEHALVKPTDLSKVGLAFFTINGIISLTLGLLGIIDVFF
jgi:4-hydroxybenzoate polyprenyltransferase